MKYRDYVLCKKENGKTELFYAPRWSDLQEGDLVVVESHEGEMSATVLASVTVRSEEKDLLNFILKATNNSAESVKRVISRIVFKELEFTED